MPRTIKVNTTETHMISLEEVERISGEKLMEWYGEKTRDLVVFTDSALADMKQHMHWGKNHANNLFEQQMVSVGYKCYDQKYKKHYILVCYVMYTYCSERSKVGASQICQERQVMVDSQMMEELAFLNKARDYGDENPFYSTLGDVTIVGKIHTHPNMNVFLSSVDQRGHISGSDFWVDIVANPQDKKIAAFGAADAHPCQILVLNQEQNYAVNEDKSSAVQPPRLKKSEEQVTVCVEVPRGSDYYIRQKRKKFVLVCKARKGSILDYLMFKKEMKKLE